MTYIKIILTVIAVLLTLHLVKPLIVSNAQAGPEVIDVNIVKVGNRMIYGGNIPVEIKDRCAYDIERLRFSKSS